MAEGVGFEPTIFESCSAAFTPTEPMTLCRFFGSVRAVNWLRPSLVRSLRSARRPPVSTSETGSRLLQLDGWRGIIVGGNAALGAVVAQHNVEWSIRNRQPIFKGYALWLFGSHVNRQRIIRVEARS